jgi:ribonuclease P protein component
MLPKQHRLTRSRDFTRIRRFGRSSGSRLIVLYVLPSQSRDIRVGFSVSKRVGKATVRNHVKRMMREAVRHKLEEIRPGQDLVFIARPAAAEANYRQIVDAVVQLLQRTNALVASGTRRNA